MAVNEEYENKRQTHSGFKNKVVLDCGKKRVCPDVDVELDDEHLVSVIYEGRDFVVEPACIIESARRR